jgi:hypothetical protein
MRNAMVDWLADTGAVRWRIANGFDSDDSYDE